MENMNYYLELFRDEVMNSIINAPTDSVTIDYLINCVKENYETVLETIRAESKQ